MWTGATESLQCKLTNVAFLRTHIEVIDRFFSPSEVNEIWLTFSDPHMKKPTKRLTSSYFLERYRHFLVDGGLVHVKTDSNFLFTYTKALVEKNHLPMICCTEDLYHAEIPTELVGPRILSIQTAYEQQWLDRGLNIRYIQFRLPTLGTLVEPDIEIPLDEYRSFHRDKRSGLTVSR